MERVFFVSDLQQMSHLPSQPRLISAVQRNDVVQVGALLAIGGDPDVRDANDYTLLHLASMGGHTKIVEKLLDAGAHIYATNNTNANALMLAAINGHADTVDCLINKGFDPNHANANCFANALLQAANAGLEDMALRLIDHGADPRCRWENDISLMTIAAAQGMKHLVQKAYDLTGMDNYALVQAMIQRQSDTVAQLLQLGADPCTTNRQGQSLLYVLASRKPDPSGQDILMAKMLIDHGADPEAQALGDITSARKRAHELGNLALCAAFNQRSHRTTLDPDVCLDATTKPTKLLKKMQLRIPPS